MPLAALLALIAIVIGAFFFCRAPIDQWGFTTTWHGAAAFWLIAIGIATLSSLGLIAAVWSLR